MLLNMALVWLMMYFSICLMIIISICFIIIVSREYFEITFISRKKGLCWPSVWDYLHFDIRSAQSLKAICYALRFDMIYDFHFEMSNAFLFSFWNALWLSFRNEWAKFSSIELFSSGATQIFYWRKHPIIYIFRTQFFAQGLVPILALK